MDKKTNNLVNRKKTDVTNNERDGLLAELYKEKIVTALHPMIFIALNYAKSVLNEPST